MPQEPIGQSSIPTVESLIAATLDLSCKQAFLSKPLLGILQTRLWKHCYFFTSDLLKTSKNWTLPLSFMCFPLATAFLSCDTTFAFFYKLSNQLFSIQSLLLLLLLAAKKAKRELLLQQLSTSSFSKWILALLKVLHVSHAGNRTRSSSSWKVWDLRFESGEALQRVKISYDLSHTITLIASSCSCLIQRSDRPVGFHLWTVHMMDKISMS